MHAIQQPEWPHRTRTVAAHAVDERKPLAPRRQETQVLEPDAQLCGITIHAVQCRVCRKPAEEGELRMFEHRAHGSTLRAFAKTDIRIPQRLIQRGKRKARCESANTAVATASMLQVLGS